MGSALILVAVNEQWDSREFDAPPLGMPASEAWPDPTWRPVQVAMLDVLRSGVGITMQLPGGPIRLSPYRRDGRVVGVVTTYELRRPSPARRRQSLDPVESRF